MNYLMEKYNDFDDKEKTMFSKSINKLMNEKFITALKEEDRDYYYYIKNNLKLINDYLSVIEMEVKYNSNIKVLQLVEENQLRISLSKLNSIILLILRLIYNQKLKEVTSSSCVCITAKEVTSMYNNFNFKDTLYNTSLKEGLKIFKRYNIVNYSWNDVNKSLSVITIYPTIISLLSIQDIDDIYNKINNYKEEKNEETYED